MTGYQSLGFDEVLEIVESLPYAQQENLIEVIRHRLIESRRDSIARNIRLAREQYAKGEVKTGTVDDLMAEIDR
uniref:Addiction module component n=1 Tax=Candidatus Kentrum sp. FW TaxID=2126338 RepID=A0A450S445_9GAMM|nr:MAG: hypothetical protein BECKFW1821A_GA0114235_10112 [Candidatus Kentron sp. FW]VFJ46520.1 MAG: hypothetical protein BECKFW1821B_GA0114236_10015 [Candidatus Kentron sp. FW]